MSTGACGISCDACRLRLLGVCSTCGPGTSEEARRKIEAQQRLFGQPCPMLACAQAKAIPYCLRDCDDFPCERFGTGPYPYSQGFLGMQERRRRQPPQRKSPLGNTVAVPAEYWDELQEKDLRILCRNSLALPLPSGGVVVPCLRRQLEVDFSTRSIRWFGGDGQGAVKDPLLELLTLVYLLKAAPAPLAGSLVSVRELKDAHFFSGPHELRAAPVLERFGEDLDGFCAAATALGGSRFEGADAGYCLKPFPKVPLTYLLWKGDEEFPPSLSILFDRSVELHLAADAIWGVVHFTSGALLGEW